MRIGRDEAGATAIEYGLIAGLVALGLLGSLVGTRGSLNAVFGAVSSGVASGGGASVSPALPGAAHWQAKTLSAGYPTYFANSSGQGATYRYTDGSSVTMVKSLNADGSPSAFRGEFVDGARDLSQKAYFYTDPNGNQNLFQIANYTGPDMKGVKNYTYNTSYGGTETTTTYLYPGTTNASSTTSTSPVTAAFRSLNDVYGSEYAYFLSLGFTKPN